MGAGQPAVAPAVGRDPRRLPRRTRPLDTDNYYAFASATSVVHRRSLDVSPLPLPAGDPRLMQLGDKRLDFFPWTVALVAVPAVIGLDLAHVAGVGPGSEDLDMAQVLMVEMLLGSILVATAAVLAGVAAARLARDPRRRRMVGVTTALLLAFATGAWSTASRSLNQHAPSLALAAAALVLAIGLAQRRAPRPTASALGLGLLLGAGYTVRPTNVLLLAAVLVWLLIHHRRLVGAFVVGVAAIAVPWAAVNGLTYGAVVPPYFAGDRLGLHRGTAEALAANLVSPSRGLLLFAPLIVVLAVVGTARIIRGSAGSDTPSQRWLAGLVAAAGVAQWLVVSTFPHWWAGHSYGPRFLTETMVPMAVLSAPALEVLSAAAGAPGRWRHPAVAAVALLSVWSVGVHAQPRPSCPRPPAGTPRPTSTPTRSGCGPGPIRSSWPAPARSAGLTPGSVLRSYTERSRC